MLLPNVNTGLLSLLTLRILTHHAIDLGNHIAFCLQMQAGLTEYVCLLFAKSVKSPKLKIKTQSNVWHMERPRPLPYALGLLSEQSVFQQAGALEQLPLLQCNTSYNITIDKAHC